jgi:hypothetical protein
MSNKLTRTMTYKIFNEGNQTIIEDSEGRQLVGLAKDVFIRPANNLYPNPEYYIEGIRGWDSTQTIALDEIVDTNDVPVTLGDFKTFYQNELGKGSAGSAAVTTLRIQNQTLTAANWVLNTDTNLYEYNYSNENIVLASEPEMIPHNDSVDEVSAASILPYTTVLDGGMVVYAENLPTSDIIVSIIIKPVQDV